MTKESYNFGVDTEAKRLYTETSGMTAKRFILIDGVKKGTHSGIWDNLKQNNQRVGDELWVCEVVAMLNEGIAIVEENEQLKHQLSQQEMEYATDCYRLAEENMQLQEELDYYKTKCGSLETALVQGRRAVDKEKEQRMFFVDMEKQRKMFR